MTIRLKLDRLLRSIGLKGDIKVIRFLSPRERYKWSETKAKIVENLLKSKLPPEDFRKIGIEYHHDGVFIYIIEYLPKESYERFLEIINLEKARWEWRHRWWRIRPPYRVSQPIIKGREVKE